MDIGEIIGTIRLIDPACTVLEAWGETTVSISADALSAVAGRLAPHTVLVDVSGADYPKRLHRFDLAYHLRPLSRPGTFFRIKTTTDEAAPVASVTPFWPAANWYEREIHDLFGVNFSGHPNLKRLLMPDNWVGHPLRKDYAMGGEEVTFSWNTSDSVTPHSLISDEGLDGHVEVGPEELAAFRAETFSDKGERFMVNMGPQHPGTHGLLRLALELQGETVRKAIPHIGYLHTGIEKTMESLSWQQALTCTDRMDYLAPLSNNLAYVLGVERLLGVEIPQRAQYLRVILCELTRISSHLLAVGAQAMDIGAVSVFLYCFREREKIMDIFEITSGVRMMTSFINVGGLRDDIPDGFIEKTRAVVDTFPACFEEYEAMLTKNPIWLERNIGVGKLDPMLAVMYAVTGPILRAAGIRRDLRKDAPYSSYDHFEFDIPTGSNSDCFDRYTVRMEEMRQSLGIIRQALDRLPGGPVKADDRKVVLPPRDELDKSMEALIHHFLLSSRGFTVPAGEVYSAVEGPRGESAFYLVSDGGVKPYRAKARGASFANFQASPLMLEGGMVADAVATIGSLDPVLGDIDR